MTLRTARLPELPPGREEVEEEGEARGAFALPLPQRRNESADAARGSVAAAAVAVTDRLGFPRAVLRDRIGISPACGLAGATDTWARSAIELAHRFADVMASEPESV